VNSTTLTKSVMIFMIIILSFALLQHNASRLHHMSLMLSGVDWGAMFSLAVFVIMLAAAIKIAAPPIFTIIKAIKGDNGDHGH
jgi:hypothetical protein